MRGARRGESESGVPSEENLLTRPAPPEPATFDGAKVVGDFLVQDWTTAYGTIGWAHPLKATSPPVRWVADAVYSESLDHMHEWYAAFVVVEAALNLDIAPQLHAMDVRSGNRLSNAYEVTWRQASSILGARPPWFHHALRDLKAMSAWKPGDPPAIVAADDIETPARALLELAADEPEGSPAATVCLWLARHSRRQSVISAQQAIEEVRTEASTPGSDCAYVNIAAVPVPLVRPEDDLLGETIQRAGWAQIVERRDVLAAAAADIVLRWDGGKAWPTGETAEFDPASSPAAAEWSAQLRPASTDQPPTVLERLLLEHVSAVDRAVELLYDDTSGCPALRRTDHMGETTVYARVPQRISTLAPLSEVTLGGHTVWIRTADNRLWLAPAVEGHGLSWGYGGGGPQALTALLDMLLKDITSPPVTRYSRMSDGLFSLIRSTPQDGVTTYSRAQLLAARDR
jgi:hypothetical protein